MAHLLGSQFCIESLRVDVLDIQQSITDVFSRSGPVELPSWKYPDKKSNEVDVKHLLELYEYSHEVEDNQVAHIVLLELAIDRLVLLLQGMAKYLEQILNNSRAASAVKNGSNTSIGLTVKKYWNKMVQLQSVMQQALAENKGNVRKLEEKESHIIQLERELERMKGGSACLPADIHHLSISSTPTSAVFKDIARYETSRPSQTLETAFVPCEGCHRVQRCLREVGESMNRICSSQQLPCSLAKHQAEMQAVDWLTSNDVIRWSAEQQKDLERINSHFSYLLNTIEPLKHDLSKERAKNTDLEKKLEQCRKELKSEKDTQTIMQKQYENKAKEIELKKTEAESRWRKQSKKLEIEKNEAEKCITSLKSETRELKDTIHSLEIEVSHERENIVINRQEIIEASQQEIKSLQSELLSLSTKLTSIERDLNKERFKTKSLNMQSESVQQKRDAMLQRIDVLDLENDKLQGEIAELEEVKERLEESLDKAEEKRKSGELECREQKTLVSTLKSNNGYLQSTVKELEENTKNLEARIEQLKDNEKLFIMYPDLNGPVNADISGTGDVSRDMENQIKANVKRITILQEQNTTLRNSIAKIMEVQQNKPESTHKATPIPLWKPQNVSKYLSETSSEAHSVASGVESYERNVIQPRPKSRHPVLDEKNYVYQSFSAGRPMSNYSEKKSPPKRSPSFTAGRPLSNYGEKISPPKSSSSFSAGRPMSNYNDKISPPKSSSNQSSSFSAYMKLKNAGMLKSPGSGSVRRSNSAKVSSLRAEYEPSEIFTCSKCDKIYNSRRDLEIHNTYCYGGLV